MKRKIITISLSLLLTFTIIFNLNETKVSALAMPLFLPTDLTIYPPSNYQKYNALINVCDIAGYDLTANCMRLSLKSSNKNKTITYGNKSSFSNAVKSTKEYKTVQNKIAKQIKLYLKKHPKAKHLCSTKRKVMPLTSNIDLYLAVHNIDYTFEAKKFGANWRITIRLFDTYNFEYWKYKSAKHLKHNVVSLINNYAYTLQTKNIIVPYRLRIIMPTYTLFNHTLKSIRC